MVYTSFLKGKALNKYINALQKEAYSVCSIIAGIENWTLMEPKRIMTIMKALKKVMVT